MKEIPMSKFILWWLLAAIVGILFFSCSTYAFKDVAHAKAKAHKFSPQFIRDKFQAIKSLLAGMKNL